MNNNSPRMQIKCTIKSVGEKRDFDKKKNRTKLEKVMEFENGILQAWKSFELL